jgi:N-terminal acetyltransferase B complex non-catalytic subunit
LSATDVLTSFISFSSDDWISWKVYFDALFEQISENPETEQEKLDETKSFIETLKKSALAASILKRGPFMAELELDSRLKKANKIGNCLSIH